MIKYRVYIEGTNYPGEYLDEIFNSYSDAEEAAYEAMSEIREGAEVLHMSNPGDYDYDENNYELHYTIDTIETSEFSSVDWYCDSCNAHLNDQVGFNTESGKWECTECGHVNSVSDEDIGSIG